MRFVFHVVDRSGGVGIPAQAITRATIPPTPDTTMPKRPARPKAASARLPDRPEARSSPAAVGANPSPSRSAIPMATSPASSAKPKPVGGLSNPTPTAKAAALAEWPDERWLDTRSGNVREIMRGRLQLARDKGCDGVEPDNVDGFDNNNGLGLTAAADNL